MKVATYNILDPELALFWKNPEGVEEKEGQLVDNWHQRHFRIASNIQDMNPDIICFQEVTHQTLLDLGKLLPQYQARGPVPHKKGETTGYGNAILFKANRFDLEKNIELRTTDQGVSRAAIALDLKDKETQITIRVASLHLTGYNYHQSTEKERALGLDQLKFFTKALEKFPVSGLILAGDFNEDATMPERTRFLQESGYISDGALSPTEPSSQRKIDWIFMKGALFSDLMPLSQNGPHPQASDHLLTGTSFEIKEPLQHVSSF